MFIPAPGGGGTTPVGLGGLSWAWANMQWEIRVNEPGRYGQVLAWQRWFTGRF